MEPKKRTFDYDGEIVEFIATPTNIHIVDSYRFNSKKDIDAILNSISEWLEKEDMLYTRTKESWRKEWLAHNLLYRIGYKKERTGSTDLSEDESALRLFLYSILSLFNKG